MDDDAHVCFCCSVCKQLKDFGGPYLNDHLRQISAMTQQVIQSHIDGPCFSVGDLLDQLIATMQPASGFGSMVLVKGGSSSGKTALICQAIQRLKMQQQQQQQQQPRGSSDREGSGDCPPSAVVFLQQALDTPQLWTSSR